MSKPRIENVNLYEILGVPITANEQEIKKSYRKKALKCHPDKNPDDPKAAETFHQLSHALEVLTDAAAKEAYDKVLRAKEAAKLRHQELDSKRQKLKEDLERREKEANSSKNSFSNLTDEQKLAAEIERLQREGSRLLQEEQQKMKEELLRNINNDDWDSSLNRIKIKWNASRDDSNNGGYNEIVLRKILKKYGDIVALIISPKKLGSALVEYSSREASEMALELEKGLPDNPLTLKWLDGKSNLKSNKSVITSSVVSDRDYETLVLRKMRQAAERQKLIDEIMNEEK